MLENIEEKIIETFNEYEVKTKSEDILRKVSKKKKSNFSQKIFVGFGSALTFATIALLIIIPKGQTNNSSSEISSSFSIIEKYNQKEYSSMLLSATDSFNSLIPNTLLLNKQNDFNIESLVKETFKNFESSVRFNFNFETLETSFIKEKNSLYNVDYNYREDIKDLNFNQNYTFYYNVNELDDSLNGVIFNSSNENYKMLTINVDSKFIKNDSNYYLESCFTPQILGQDMQYSFNIKEKDNNCLSYEYYYGNEIIFTYQIETKNSEEMSLEYQSIDNSIYYFTLKKLNITSYEVSYSLYEIINGSFIVNYDLENKDYEINFVI